MFIQIHDYVDITFFPRNMAVCLFLRSMRERELNLFRRLRHASRDLGPFKNDVTQKMPFFKTPLPPCHALSQILYPPPPPPPYVTSHF